MKLKVVEYFESYEEFNSWAFKFVQKHDRFALNIVCNKTTAGGVPVFYMEVTGCFVKKDFGGKNEKNIQETL